MSDNTPHTHIFVAYASEDRTVADTFLSHLELLKREIPTVKISSSADIMPGVDIKKKTQTELERADFVLMLITKDFFRSGDYINGNSQSYKATFVPVLLHPCMWDSDPFLEKYQPLPRNGVFISTSENQEEAYLDVVKEVRKMVVGEPEDTFTSSPKKKPYLWVVAALAAILLTGLTLFWNNPNKANLTEDTRIKPIFETTDTTFKILILRFEDYISKKETECIGLSVKKLLKNLRDNKGMPLNPVYENSILSPEDLDSVKYLQKYHNADLLLYGLANQIKPECEGANVCFRRLVADTIMVNIDVPDDVTKVIHESDYELTSPLAIEQGKLSVDNQSMEAWIRALIALKKGNTEIYLFEIENMVGDISGLTDREKAIKYYNQGKVYYNSKKLEQAILSFDKAIKLLPSHVSSYSYRSRCLHDIDRHDEAVQDCDTLIKLHSNAYYYYVRRGDNLRHLGEIDEALSSLEEAICISPELYMAYYIRGLVHYDSKDYKNAIVNFTESLSIKKDHSPSYLNRGALFGIEGYHRRAIHDFTQTIKLTSENFRAYTNRGMAYTELKKYKKALEDFNKAIELEPNFATAYFNRAIIIQSFKKIS